MLNNRIDDETKRRARQADAVEYLKNKGFELKRKGKDYYPVSPVYHDSLLIKDNMFQWKRKGCEGNTITLAEELFGFGFREAIEDILSSGASVVPPRMDAGKDNLNSGRSGEVTMPEKAPDEKRVIAYLLKKRSLKYELITKMIKDGRLYQDLKGNCAFVIQNIIHGKTENVGAEIVGTGEERFKQALGNGGYCFELKLGDWSRDCKPTFFYFESVIDLLSYCQLKKLDERKEPMYLISLRGVNGDAIKKNIRRSVMVCPGARHYVATDNDAAGDRVADEIITWWQSDPMKQGDNLSRFTVQRLRPDEGFKDWNDMLTGTPIES